MNSGNYPVRSETKDKSGVTKSKSKASASTPSTASSAQKPTKQIVVGSKVIILLAHSYTGLAHICAITIHDFGCD